MVLKKSSSICAAAYVATAALCLLAIVLTAPSAWSAPCDLKPGTPAIIRHDLGTSYCELCGYGYVTVIISNGYEEVDMTQMTLVENLASSGLTFAPAAPTPVRYQVNGGPWMVGIAPAVSGPNNSILTWTSAEIPALASLAYAPGIHDINSLTVTFAVAHHDPSIQEQLVGATRLIQADLTYDTEGDEACFPGLATVGTGLNLLPLREPEPEVFKQGRNVDAGQDSGEYSGAVYGNVNDDLIWRVRVTNDGSAALQDLRFDDLMGTTNIDINYVCPTEATAATVAANDGVDPGGTGCVPVIGNSVDNFDVDNPFGEPATDSPDLVDVPEMDSADIFLVGKVPSTPNGSCGAATTNTVSDVQWGCQSQTPAGGILATSAGASPGTASATLSTFSDAGGTNLSIVTQYIGIASAAQPAGARGRVRITIRNLTGGTIKGIHLRDVLPAEYVVDPTFTPNITAYGAYGTYPGLTDRIEWTNPAGGTVPLTTTDPAVALSNTAPEFRLYSSTTHPDHADQFDLLRHGDRLVINFGVILVRPESYDRTANLDVRTEDPASDPPGTDPANAIEVENRLYVDFENFCQPGVTQHPPNYPIVTTHQTDPEDLDINIAGSELVFILTGDPAQRLPLTVNLTNNGGHQAEDYYAYVSFGETMQVVTVPAGCSLTANPPAHREWQLPASIPSTAAVYQCSNGGSIAPGQTVGFTFEVVKSSDPGALAADDLTFRADVTGEITLYDGTPLWFPTSTARADGITDSANTYSVDGVRARVVGFNLLKSQVGTCSENNPPPGSPDLLVQIGEECAYHIDTGGWFGFQTPGFTYIAVQDIQVVDQLPDGQGYISSTDPYAASTSDIQGVTLNPAGLSPLDEAVAPDYVNWTFNTVVPSQRINVIDQWFRVDLRSRLLNDPQNVSAAPNRHAALSTNTLNSYFQAVFFNDSTGMEEVYDLGPGTIGYPRVEVRRFSLTVTEPEITVVKEVCNETLYGAGPSCSHFVPLADDGDAYDNYVYRITLTNTAAADGVTRAPAYDVTVTDTLDAMDLAYVLPFGADGLNNDGDGATDEAGAGSEGSIGDNVVDNGTPAQIIFSYTHSTALQRIDPGASVQLYYRVDFDDDAAPLQTFTNTAGAAYDSLEGGIVDDFSNQSVPQRPNGDIGGARIYTSDAASAAVRIIPVETEPKRIASLSNTPLATAPAVQGVSIGEEIEYRLTTSLPVALLRNFVIRDELPEGMRCVEAPAVNLDAPPYAAAGFDPGGVITPTCGDDFVEWQFGDQRVTNGTMGERYDLDIGFIARTENTAAVNDGDVMSNGDPATQAFARYLDENGTAVTIDFGQVDVVVREPLIEMTKAFAVAAADAADVLTVTVTATNTGTATAYNLRVLDDLDGRNLTYIGNVSGTQPPDHVDITTLGANRPIFSWNAPNGIDPGGTIGFTFDVRVDDVVEPLEVLDNTLQADWTSLPGRTTALNSSGLIGADGTESGMRVGALPHAGDAVNDYETVAGAQVTVPAVSLTKSDLDPAGVPTIGAHKTFRLDIRLPEGVTQNVRVADSLDAAGLSYVLENNTGFDVTYTFEGIAAINGLAPAEAALNAFPVDGSSGSVVWDIGTVVTQTENDPSAGAIDPLIRIQYYARVNNDLDTDMGDSLQNGATVTSTHGETGADETAADDTDPVTVAEPQLTATKTVSNVTNPGNPPGGGDVLEYVVSVTNAGTATAYDVNVVDTLPANLTFYNGFTPTALIAGTAVAGFIPNPANEPAGPLVWGRDNADESLDIPTGQSLVLTYQTVVLAMGGDISNSVTGDWTSLDGTSSLERTGEGCGVASDPNDYCFGPVVATVATVDTTSIAKNITADTFDTVPWSTTADAVARIGDFVTYRLALNLTGGLTQAIEVRDQLPGGMAFVGTISINGDPTVNYTPPASGAGSNFSYAPITSAGVPAVGATGTLSWMIGDVNNDPFGDPTTDTLEILYLARILPDAGIPHVDTTTLTNTAAMDYATAAGPAATLTASTDLTLVQPILAVAKSAVASGGDTVLDANEPVTYTIDIANTGGAPAYDARLTDIIPVGMRDAGITMVSTELVSGTSLPVLAPAFDAATGQATWELDTGTPDAYTIPAGDTLRIVYTITTDAGLAAGMTLTNQAQVQHYWSLEDDAIPTYAGVHGEPQLYGPTAVAGVTFTTDAADPLTKENPAQTTVAVGELFVYRLTVPGTPMATALHDVRILDDLDASAADLSFVSVARISGSQPWTPVNTGTVTNLVIEDTTVGIDIPAGEQIVVEITVLVADTATNIPGLTFTNTADYTYNQVNDDAATRTPGGDDTTDPMTIVGADSVVMAKTGPATMQLATPGAYTIDLHNTGSGTLWNPTVVDQIPNTADGGMCAAGPANITAQIFQDDGTPASPVLTEGTDYTVAFDGDPSCQWQLDLLSPAAGVPADHHLVITYDLELDADTANGVTLTNIAGVTRWYSADPDGAGTPHTYTGPLTDGTPGTADNQDDHSVTTEAPVLNFEKTVINATTTQDPGSDASPGDTLRYTLTVTNAGPAGLSNFTITDELDALHATPIFAAGTLTLVSVPPGAGTSATDANGGTNGTGLVSVGNLNLGAAGSGDDTLAITFEVTLAPVIANGTVVHNQAQLTAIDPTPMLSDDPNLGGTVDPTQTLITSAPEFQVLKTSAVLDGDPAVLLAGERLRYTITVKNIGNEDAVNANLRDSIPASTTYVTNSTTLNGTTVADSAAGVNPLESGMPIHAQENTTPGYMRADSDASAGNVATVTFDVLVDPAAMDGLVISNQGFAGGEGDGGATLPEQPSDDPDTTVPDDPTLDVVGSLPLLYAHKTVAIAVDGGTAGIVDPGDTLSYTIAISNTGAIDATGVVLSDTVPANTTYVADSLQLNGTTVTGAAMPLLPPGLSVHSSDNPGAGIISAGQSATVTFQVTVDPGTPTGTVISNQGTVTSNELADEPTDADGVPANGDQPTLVVVGDAQLLTITKEVAVVGGGAALPGAELEYVLRVTNAGSLAATDVVITDALTTPPLDTQIAYVTGSGTLDGAINGVSYAGGVLEADYAATYGDLASGDTAVVRFRVQIDTGLTAGTTISNTGEVAWNGGTQTDSASVSIDVGGTAGSATLNGAVWHDMNFDRNPDTATETPMEGWRVELYRNGSLAASALTDAGGAYMLNGLVPNNVTGDIYELRFLAPGAGADTASMGTTDSPFTDGHQRITAITVASGSNILDLNLPLWPNGAVYDAMARTPVARARLTLVDASSGTAVSDACFDDPAQQGQVTTANGFYKFDLNAACPGVGDYLIEVTPPTSGYVAPPSAIIPPTTDAGTAAYDVNSCPDDALTGIPNCQATPHAAIPPASVAPGDPGTAYYLHLSMEGGAPPINQIFYNPIPLDPETDSAVAITKTASLINVTRGSMVPYTITVTNVFGVPLYDSAIVDRFPAGFKYVAGSAHLDGAAVEPQINGLQLTWDDLDLTVNQVVTIKLLLVVGSGVSEGEYVNRAWVINTAMGATISGEATATVRVIPDPDFDCTDVIGKVFDDRNLNGYPDEGESGLPGVRVVTARGLIATSDEHGRFHITCAAVPDEDRGSNFILKLDERSLPTGYRLTSENPRVQRATRGKMLRFHFGATIHRVVRMDMADGAFETHTSELRLQWVPRIEELVAELGRSPSLLRLSYLADIEEEALVRERLDALKKRIVRRWEEVDGGYRLAVETEVFWRRGGPYTGR
ncbi:DUF11 domain-containing protein [Desulfatitalea tepidiphila]|uniref:DUF11 domain-containing protein n=1 Tax=Desulfatitalea tepidiphila TaxID=1185843 RepID=UPI0006B49C21|nr:DUF11 domain-containing protein [Desulfatitalea tepidiphila]